MIELFDRFLQFIGCEFIEVLIKRFSLYLTKLFLYVCSLYNKTGIFFRIQRIVTIYRSEHFLIIDKPPDLVINSNDPSKISVQTVLRKQFPELVDKKLTHEFFFAHRLDYSTSGILCLPLNKCACAAMSKSLEERVSKKFYIALVNGHIIETLKIIDLDIGEDIRFEDSSKQMCTKNEQDFCRNPRKSLTHLAVVEKGFYYDQPITKVILKPLTGRRHQLRLHCQALGHPILGDYTYGSTKDQKMDRMYLHAIKLVIPNAVESICVETDDPFTENKIKNLKFLLRERLLLKKVYDLLENGGDGRYII